MGLAVPLPDVGPQLSDNHDWIAFAYALRYVLCQGAKAGDLDPGRVAVAPSALRSDARCTCQPERRHGSAAADLNLGSGIAGDVYLCLHRLVLSLPDNASSSSGCGRGPRSCSRCEICGRSLEPPFACGQAERSGRRVCSGSCALSPSTRSGRRLSKRPSTGSGRRWGRAQGANGVRLRRRSGQGTDSKKLRRTAFVLAIHLAVRRRWHRHRPGSRQQWGEKRLEDQHSGG